MPGMSRVSSCVTRQTVVVDHVDTVPAARQFRYSDYWATTVTVFDLHSPHERLEVIGYHHAIQQPGGQGPDWLSDGFG